MAPRCIVVIGAIPGYTIVRDAAPSYILDDAAQGPIVVRGVAPGRTIVRDVPPSRVLLTTLSRRR